MTARMWRKAFRRAAATRPHPRDLATDLFSPKTLQAEQDQTKTCEQHAHPAMPVFSISDLASCRLRRICGLSLGEFTFGQRTFKLLVGVSVERLTHHN